MKEVKNLSPARMKEKPQELWGNRRKFITRGFWGAAIVFSGAANASRGTTELVLRNPEGTVKSPLLLPKIPENADEVPYYISQTPAAVIAVANEVAEHTEKIASTRIDIKPDCYVDGEKEYRPFLIDTPYADNIEGVCSESKEESLRKAELWQARALQDKPASTSGPSVRMGFGTVLLGVGYLVAKGKDTDNNLTRRAFLSKVQSGALVGIGWYALEKFRKEY